MLYKYPPTPWHDSESWMWFGTNVAAWGVSIALILGAVIYFARAFCGKPSADWMWVGWLFGGLLDLGLVILIGVAGLLNGNFVLAVVHFPVLLVGLLALVHCSLALRAGNLNVRRQAEVIVQVLMATGAVILVGLFMLPATRNAREASRRSQCKNNLKQIGLAHHNFQDERGHFTDSIVRLKDRAPYSWRVELLPYIDQAPLFHVYQKAAAWDSPANIEIAQKQILTYSCPSLPRELDKNAAGHYHTAYAVVTGAGTAFPNGKGLKLQQIKDGTSNTVLVVEACGQQIVWSEPRDIELSSLKVGVNLPGTQPNHSPGTWSSFHRGGAHTLLADGSVRFISEKVDPNVTKALLSATGGETIGEF